jgi:hypothetical protein
MIRRAEEGKAAIVRSNEQEAIVIFAPPFDAGGQWHEITSGMREKTHTFSDVLQALGGSEDGGRMTKPCGMIFTVAI